MTVLIITATGSYAQDGSASADLDALPIMQTLALVPDMGNNWTETVSYVDYAALAATRPGAVVPEDAAAFEAALDADEENDGYELWFATLGAIANGPDTLLQHIARSVSVEELVGFSFFDVDRAVVFGQPVNDGQILVGDFDTDTVIAAYEDLEFVVQDADDPALLCWSAGCDRGIDVNVSEREPYNPFGGEIGMRWPMIVSGDVLAASRQIEIAQALRSAYRGESEATLADAPAFRAAVDGLTSVEGRTITQSYFIDLRDGEAERDYFPIAVGPGITAGNAQATREAFVPLPAFELFALADLVDADAQYAVFALVYEDAADAETAAAMIDDNLEGAISLRFRRPWSDIFAERMVTVQPATVYTSDEYGRSVVLLTWAGPLPFNERLTTSPVSFQSSSLTYRLAIDALFAADLLWLSPGM